MILRVRVVEVNQALNANFVKVALTYSHKDGGSLQITTQPSHVVIQWDGPLPKIGDSWELKLDHKEGSPLPWQKEKFYSAYKGD